MAVIGRTSHFAFYSLDGNRSRMVQSERDRKDLRRHIYHDPGKELRILGIIPHWAAYHNAIPQGFQKQYG